MKNKNEVIDYQKKQIADLELKKQTLKSENTALKNKEANRLKEMSSQQYGKAALKDDPSGKLQNDQGIFSKDNELEYYQHQLKSLKKLVNCSICDQNQKEIALPCGHLLCEKCLKKQKESRMRNCPIDRKKFTDKQPMKIYLNDAADEDLYGDEVMQYD